MNSKSIVFLDLRGRPQLKRTLRDVVHRTNTARRRMPANQKLERMERFFAIICAPPHERSGGYGQRAAA